ncbi:MAG TPA: aminopeptidase P family N-terminal domain-containing protein [Polyangia bacterium]
MGRRRVTWARDDAKLERVRALMGEHDLDALVVRAPDNVLYLTNFWGMKGYDACVFPREGEPVLITIEASAEDAASLYLKPGDVIDAEIDGIGVLRNPVISWQEGHGEPAPARIRPWGEDA